MSLTDVLLDGLRLRLETPAGPRDIIVAQDNTVIQELHGMVDAAVEAALARERTRAPSRDMPTLVAAPAAPIPDLSHDCNITVIQEKDAAPPDEDLILSNPPGAIDAQIAQHITRLEDRIHEIRHDDNDTVIHESIVEAAIMPSDAMRYYYNNTVIQEETVQVSDVGDTACQTAVPPFDTSKRYLGPLCPQGHDWAGTGQSLRNKKSHNCLACNRTYRREAATGGNKGMAVSV